MDSCYMQDCNQQQKRNILIVVLIINTIMFLVQFCAAWFAHSTSLLADSLDMLGDALTYILSLYAASRGQQWLARAAMFKGIIIIIFAGVVLFEAIYKIYFFITIPHVGIMSLFSVLGLIANFICFYLLTKQRHQDVNMHSTWICARNDMMVNLSVLLTAGFVTLTHSRWPDIVVGLIIGGLLLLSALKIIRIAVAENTQHIPISN